MPCDTITVARLNMAETNIDTLYEVLDSRGLSPSKTDWGIAFEGGTYEKSNGFIRADGRTISKIHKEYTRKIVMDQAKKSGWNVVAQGDSLSMKKGFKDKINVEILYDGKLRITTDKISPANHGGAEILIREIVKAMGGDSERVRKTIANVRGSFNGGLKI